MKTDEKRQHDIGKCEIIGTQDPLKEPQSETFLHGVCECFLCPTVSNQTNFSSVRSVRRRPAVGLGCSYGIAKNPATFFFWREKEASSCQRFQTNHTCSIQFKPYCRKFSAANAGARTARFGFWGLYVFTKFSDDFNLLTFHELSK